MEPQNTRLRERYRFIDFLYYITLCAVPFLTACYAIYKHALGWMLVYLVLCIAGVTIIYRYYCSHCPHYTREGRTTHCMFFWGMPKFFKPRPEPLGFLDKTLALLSSFILGAFPLYWLFQEPGLLVIAVLSLIAFLTSVRRNECSRCIYFECPVNKTPEELKSNEDIA